MTSSLKNYLLLIFLATMLFWAAWILIILKVDPYIGGRNMIILFFISLFLSLTGLLTLIGFLLRIWFSKNELINLYLRPSVRQAILISLCIIVLLSIQILRLVNIWSGLLIVLAILSLEFFFRTKKEKVKRI